MRLSLAAHGVVHSGIQRPMPPIDHFTSIGTTILCACLRCDEVKSLNGTGAMAWLPKPYSATLVPAALQAVCRLADGDPPSSLPDSMIALAA